MYLCSSCGRVFDRPAGSVEGFVDADGRAYHQRQFHCPHCGDSDIAPAHTCGGCGGWRLGDETLCAGCRTRLGQRFRAFVEELCPEEQAVLDDWLDGVGLRTAARQHG